MIMTQRDTTDAGSSVPNFAVSPSSARYRRGEGSGGKIPSRHRSVFRSAGIVSPFGAGRDVGGKVRSACHRRQHRHRRFASVDDAGAATPASEIDDHVSTTEFDNAANEAAAVKLAGRAKHRLNFAVRREDRIETLQAGSDELVRAERSELSGLMSAREVDEERYDPDAFTPEHRDFKDMHNDALVALARYCQNDAQKRRRQEAGAGWQQGTEEAEEEEEEEDGLINIFVLDGPDGKSTRALIAGGFKADQCYVANRHESTCAALRKVESDSAGLGLGGMLPPENIVCASATEALFQGGAYCNDRESDRDEAWRLGRMEAGQLGNIDFSVYYFDGCGGYAPPVNRMLSAAFLGRDQDREGDDPSSPSSAVAVGFSIVGGNRDVMDKEVQVTRHLTQMMKEQMQGIDGGINNAIRVCHVFDDPVKYGVSKSLRKIGGGTMTSWFVLEPV